MSNYNDNVNYERLVEELMSQIQLLLTEAEEYYPEYYFMCDEGGNILEDELQTDFYAPGIFLAGSFELDVFERDRNSSNISFDFFNNNVDEYDYEYDVECLRGEHPFDTIVFEDNMISVAPYRSDHIYFAEFETHKIAGRIIKLAIDDIQEFRKKNKKERKELVKN